MMQVTNEQLKGPIVLYSPSVKRTTFLTFSAVSTLKPLTDEFNCQTYIMQATVFLA
jgi:hypothetical protein